MKQIDVKEVAKELKEVGYVVVRDFLDEKEIQEILTETIPSVTELYSEELVKTRTMYLREDSQNRQGDAVMVSLEENFNLTSGYCGSVAEPFLRLYHDIIGEVVGKVVPEDSRSMMNVQQYFEGSLEVRDHYDGEFLNFKHGPEDKYGESVLEVIEALLPRYVMVLVLENENDGKGTYIREHDSEERIEVENHPGDMIIFDNIRFRHGVPALEKPRKMIGFRNFDFEPYYFKSSLDENDSGFTELYDKINPGFIKPIDSLTATEFMIDFNNRWMNELYDEFKNRRPAF